MQHKKTAAIGIIMFTCMVLPACVTGMVYYPLDEINSTPSDIGLEYESLRIVTIDGEEISAWWIPAHGANKTVLFFHGNSGNISTCLDTIQVINNLEFNLLIVDYRGFGKSTGSPTKKGLYKDADAALHYLVEKRRINPRSIILWGRSLGGAIAARTAAENDAGILILESTFTSIIDVANDICPLIPKWLLKNHSYQTASYLEKVDIPTLIIHSIDDEIVPFHHGRRLYQSIMTPKGFLEIQGSHNQGFIDSMDAYVNGIRIFVNNQGNL